MKLRRLHHVGVVVKELPPAATTFGNVLGLERTLSIDRPEVGTSFYTCDDSSVELIHPRAADDPRLASLGTDAARIDHIAFEVDDIEAVHAALTGLGVETDGDPRPMGPFTSFFTKASPPLGFALQFVQLPETEAAR